MYGFFDIAKLDRYSLRHCRREYLSSLIISFCFNHINLHKVYLHVFESNLRAINCYKKIGMVQEGILIDHHYNNGKYENVLIMSLLNSNGI